MMKPTEDQILALANAMWDCLDDMGKNGYGVCGFAKAQARIAIEPFYDLLGAENPPWCYMMSLEDAQKVINEVNNV